MYELIENIAKFAIVSGLLTFLIKSLAKHLLNKDIQNFEFSLKKILEEHKVKFTHLHSERAQVVKNIYQLLERAYSAMYDLICPIQIGEQPLDKEKSTVEKINAFIIFYNENKIFISEKTCELVDSVVLEMKDAIKKYRRKDRGHNASQEDVVYSDEDMDNWDKAWKKVSEDVPKIKKILENEFRGILGVDVESK